MPCRPLRWAAIAALAATLNNATPTMAAEAVGQAVVIKTESIITLLKVGLDLLAVHYGMMPRGKTAVNS
ncbi:hypothetical protein FKO01_05635 [Mesorhizobium sp. B2-3-3]|nr:hypothetical protein FKO01_05635 [Mesorhizobium sp. B2-3-3]